MACGLVEDLGAGIALARETQRSGRANAVLDSWIYLSQVFNSYRIRPSHYVSCNAKSCYTSLKDWCTDCRGHLFSDVRDLLKL